MYTALEGRERIYYRWVVGPKHKTKHTKQNAHANCILQGCSTPSVPKLKILKNEDSFGKNLPTKVITVDGVLQVLISKNECPKAEC
jgi:hypothetical protein